MSFDGFISYSHAADGRLAPAVQRGLHHLAKPWHRRRALWIFRDQTGLSVTPALWTSIQNALDGSEYFVLLASPEAAASPWVNREIEHWVTTKSPDRILPVVTDGEWQWDPQRGDFTEQSTAVPAALRGVFAEEPLYLDLRWARDDQHLSLRHSRFRDAIAQLAAPMHGVSKDDLEGEDVRQHRRARRLWSFGVSALMLLTFVAVLTGLLALHNADRANASAQEARRQQQVALQQRGSAERSAQEATRQEQLALQQEQRAEQAAAEVLRQEALAEQQKGLAAKAATTAQKQQANARYQRALADVAAAKARRQEILAQQQRAAAERAAAETRRQEQKAREQEAKAREQEQRAKEAAGEARRQEKIAAEQEKKAKEAAEEGRRQQHIAISRRLLNQAKAGIDDDPRTALRLGLAAERVQPDAATRSALTGIVASTHFAGALEAAHDFAQGGNGIVALSTSKGSVKLYDATDRADPVLLSTLDSAERDLSGSFVRMSADGRTMAIQARDWSTQLWNVARPANPIKLGELPQATDVSFSPDGRILALAEEDEPVSLWETAGLAQPRRLATVPDSRYSSILGFSPDGRTLVTSFANPVTYDVSNPAQPVKLATVPASGHGETYNPARGLLAIVRDERVTIWNLADPAKPVPGTARLTIPGSVALVAFSPDGNLAAVVDVDGRVTLWSIGGPLGAVRLHSAQLQWAPTAMDFSPDGRTLFISGGSGTTLWNVADWGAPEPVVDLTGHAKPVKMLAYQPDGRTMVAVYGDGTAIFWDVTRPGNPVERAIARISDTSVDTAALSPDGRFLAVYNMAGRVQLSDVTDPDRPVALRTFDEQLSMWQYRSMAFSPDGRTLALFGSEQLRLWNVADKADPRRLGALDEPLFTGFQVAFSPNGRTLAVTSHPGVTLVDVTDPSAPANLGTVGDEVFTLSVAFSPDGRTLATGGATKKVNLWDVRNRTRPHRVATFTNHVGSFVTLAFAPDGQTLAAGIADRTVMLWDITDRNAPVRFAAARHPKGHTGIVVFNPKGDTLAAGGELGRRSASVSLWDYSALTALRTYPAGHACAIAGRGLTADEWARYVPELPYRRSCSD